MIVHFDVQSKTLSLKHEILRSSKQDPDAAPPDDNSATIDLTVALWLWLSGSGSLALALWLWLSGSGSLALALWLWPSGSGPLCCGVNV